MPSLSVHLQVSVAFVARATGVPTPGSEEEAVVSIPLRSLRNRLGEFAFDHGVVRGERKIHENEMMLDGNGQHEMQGDGMGMNGMG